MDKDNNYSHWEELAKQYGSNLPATTKCSSIKILEIEATTAAIKKHGETLVSEPSVIIEFGCGIGTNLIGIQKNFENQYYIGLDFVSEMVENAKKLADESLNTVLRGKIFFGQIDVRNLTNFPSFIQYLKNTLLLPNMVIALLETGVSIIITDRCLINLKNHEEQMKAIGSIRSLLKTDGIFLMIENSIQANNRLNAIRNLLGLPDKKIADFNVFIDEEKMKAHFLKNTYSDVIDFAGLHDMMLYGVDASLNNGNHTYDSLFMNKILALNTLLIHQEIHLPFGQNRLWIWGKNSNEKYPDSR